MPVTTAARDQSSDTRHITGNSKNASEHGRANDKGARPCVEDEGRGAGRDSLNTATPTQTEHEPANCRETGGAARVGPMWFPIAGHAVISSRRTTSAAPQQLHTAPSVGTCRATLRPPRCHTAVGLSSSGLAHSGIDTKRPYKMRGSDCVDRTFRPPQEVHLPSHLLPAVSTPTSSCTAPRHQSHVAPPPLLILYRPTSHGTSLM